MRSHQLTWANSRGKVSYVLTKSVLLPGCGHWIQQERPDEVNAALLEFLAVVAPTQRARPA
jgi:pimeloyl-ACP methyl ester carboxylesterase